MSDYGGLLLALTMVIVSIPIHETFHYLKAHRLGYKPTMKWKRRKGRKIPDLVTEWEGDDDDHEFKILFAGVFFGSLPVLALIPFLDKIGAIPVLMALIMYFILSRKDINRMVDLAEVET